MTRKLQLGNLFAPMFALVLSAATLTAAPVQWDIDSSLSSMTLTVADQSILGFPLGLRNQSGSNPTWDIGHQSPIDGTLSTNYDEPGQSIEFLPVANGQIVALDTGDYRPNPADYDSLSGEFVDDTLSPAAFGGQLMVIGFGTAGYFSINDVSYFFTSLPLAISGGTFQPTALFGMLDGSLNFDGTVVPFLGQLLPDTLDPVTPLPLEASNTQLLATITSPDPLNQPFLRRLTLPFSGETIISMQGVDVAATLSGVIVADATIVPEPGSAAMASLGFAAIGGYAWRRRRSPVSRPGCSPV